MPRSTQVGRLPALVLASVFGLGYLPKAPGTFGTLAALPLWWLLSPLPLWAFVAVTAAVSVLSIAIAGWAERIYGSHDVQHIVIDEVAGMLVAAVGVPFHWSAVVVVFVLFRFLDALKPQPVRWFDSNVKGGLGVVADDLVAGAMACLLWHGGAWLWGALL